MLKKRQRCIVLMLDGFGLDYYYQSEMPHLKAMAEKGFFQKGKAVFPTLTNANNISIICGCHPDKHGVTTNSYYDTKTNQELLLENKSFLKSSTLFDAAKKQGLKTALLTCKSKTLNILNDFVDLGIAAQDCSAKAHPVYGMAPDMYSKEVNYWLFDIALDIIKTKKDISVIYVHTTDYPMHRWAASEKDSLGHLFELDKKIGEMLETAPDAAFLVTADHGMNRKTECLDLYKICVQSGNSIKFAVSPVADRLIEHHGGHGGVSYIYLNDPKDQKAVIKFLKTLKGVDEVLTRKEAAIKYHLMKDRIGDIVVGADRDTVFGHLTQEKEVLKKNYRNHGSRFEVDIPLIAWNIDLKQLTGERIFYNYDLTRLAFFR